MRCERKLIDDLSLAHKLPRISSCQNTPVAAMLGEHANVFIARLVRVITLRKYKSANNKP
jgi:hypothetical protein